MRIPQIVILLPLLAAAGCVHSHRTVSEPVAVIRPTSSIPASRVYSETPPPPPPAAAVAPTPDIVVTAPTSKETPAGDLASAVSIRNMLAADPFLRDTAANVDIEVHNGIVVLRGAVPSEHARETLQEALEHVSGVNAVDNRIKVELK